MHADPDGLHARLASQAEQLTVFLGDLRSASLAATRRSSAGVGGGLESIHTSPRRPRHPDSPPRLALHATDLARAESRAAQLKAELRDTKKKCIAQVQEALDLVTTLQRRAEAEGALHRKLQAEQGISAQRLADLDAAQARADTACSERAALQSKCNTLRREVDALRAQDALLASEHSDIEKSLRGELARVGQSLKQARGRQAGLEESLRIAQAKLEDAGEQHSALRAAADARDRRRVSDLAALQERAAAAEEELKAQRGRQSEREAQPCGSCAALRAPLEAAEAARGAAEAAASAAEASRHAAEAASAELLGRVSEAEHGRHRAEAERDEARRQAEEPPPAPLHASEAVLAVPVACGGGGGECGGGGGGGVADAALRRAAAEAEVEAQRLREEVRLYRVDCVRREAEVERERLMYAALAADRDTARQELPLLRQALCDAAEEGAGLRGALREGHGRLAAENAHLRQVVQHFKGWAVGVLSPEQQQQQQQLFSQAPVPFGLHDMRRQ